MTVIDAGSRRDPARDQTNAPAIYTKVTLPDLSRVQLPCAARRAEVPEGPGWLHEIQHPGRRLLANIPRDGSPVRLGCGGAWSEPVPSLARALAVPSLAGCVLDGVLCVLDTAAPGDETRVVYVAFDLLFADGVDVRGAPLLDRKRALRDRVEPSSRVRVCDYVLGEGATVYDQACQRGYTGVVSKRVDSVYASGGWGRWSRFGRAVQADDAWVVVACRHRATLVVGGFSLPHGFRPHLGSLLVGSVERDGRLGYRGKVGSGFDDASRAQLREQLEPLREHRPPFHDPPPHQAIQRVAWVRPELTIEVEYSALTHKGRLLNARFKRLAADVPDVPRWSTARHSVCSRP